MPTDANLRFSNHPVAPHLAVAPALLGGTFAGNDIAVRRTPFVQQRDGARERRPRSLAPLSKQSTVQQRGAAATVQQPAVQHADSRRASR